MEVSARLPSLRTLTVAYISKSTSKVSRRKTYLDRVTTCGYGACTLGYSSRSSPHCTVVRIVQDELRERCCLRRNVDSHPSGCFFLLEHVLPLPLQIPKHVFDDL